MLFILCFAVIILAIVEFIIILLLIFLRKRIMIAIALIKEASRSVSVGRLFKSCNVQHLFSSVYPDKVEKWQDPLTNFNAAPIYIHPILNQLRVWS